MHMSTSVYTNRTDLHAPWWSHNLSACSLVQTPPHWQCGPDTPAGHWHANLYFLPKRGKLTKGKSINRNQNRLICLSASCKAANKKNEN